MKSVNAGEKRKEIYRAVCISLAVFIACFLSAINAEAISAAESERTMLVENNLICEGELNTIERAIWENKFSGSDLYDADQLPDVINSRNENLGIKALYFESNSDAGEEVIREGMRGVQSGLIEGEAIQGIESQAIIPSEHQKVDAEILIPSNEQFDSKILKIKNLTYKRNLTLGVDKLPSDRDYIHGKTELESYAINLEGLDFTIGSLTSVAKGSLLWKCALWNFTTQSCMGTWEMIQNITPGQEYNISLFPGDPGYVETFDAEQSLDVAMAALGEEEIVIAWINNETGYYASFEIWHTNGTLLVNQTNFETTGGTASRIAVEPISPTQFALGLIDSPDQDADFFIYDETGALVRGVTQLDATIGAIADIAICELGDRFVVLEENVADGDADFFIRNNDGTALVIQTAVDATTTPGAAGQNLVDCVAVNESRWIYLFYDDADNDVTNALVNGAGTILVAATDIDLDVGETGQIAGAALGGNRYAAVFYDSTDDDISMRITQVTQTNTLSIIYTGDIDLTAGVDSRVAAAEVRDSNTSYVVAAWQDQGSGDIKAGVYNASGSAITAPFTVTTDETAAYALLDVIGYNSLFGYGLCNYTFAIAYTNASMSSVFETYYLNGTRWNGTCYKYPETTPPNLQIISPENNSINDTGFLIDFVYNVTDISNIANCSLYINDVLNMTNESVVKNAEQIFSLDLENGEYTWEIGCYDQFANYNSSGVYNLTVSVTFFASNALDIDIDALDEDTIVMSWIDGGSGNYLSFEIWNTNGTRFLDRIDVDITGDASSAVAAAAVNSSHFVIGWIDGPSNSLVHTGYTIDGTNYFATATLDAAIGAYSDVDVCQIGDRYAVVNANGADSDADFRMFNNAGGSLVAETAVDTTITPGANNQNLVSCSAVNNTAWTYAFYDDADNDASMFARALGGGAIGVVQDIDLDVGEVGQVAVAGLRNNTVAYVYYDYVDSSVYLSVMELSGGTWNTILAPTVIDANAGNDSRVSAAEIEYFGRSYFVAAWYDKSDTTIKAAIYNASGGEITAPFIISTNPTSNPTIISTTGAHSNLGFGLCRRTFAVSYTNSSGHAVFRTFFYNGTIWDGECPDISPPIFENISIESLVTLNPGGRKLVQCNSTIDEGFDLSPIIVVNATLFRANLSENDAPDDNYVYKNASCSRISVSGTVSNYTCDFYPYYFAVNGSWNCTMHALNADDRQSNNSAATVVDALYAFNTSADFIDYGDLAPGQNSSDNLINLTNLGNMPVNITVYGFGGDDSSSGNGYALRCLSGENISIGNQRYALLAGRTFAQKTLLTSSPIDMNITIQKQTVVGTERRNTSYWQMYIPPLTAISECNGTIVFTAVSPG